MQFTLMMESGDTETGYERSVSLTIPPGEAVALPSGVMLAVQTISGTAYITHTGRDLLLWRGDAACLEAVPARFWGPPVVAALGNGSVTITIKTEEQRGLWERWLYERQKAPRKASPMIWAKDIWTRLQTRFGVKHTTESPVCA